MRKVLFAKWEPDRAFLGGEHATIAQGVIPAADGYRPFPSAINDVTLPPLPDQCKGAVSLFDKSGLPVVIAGTTTGLYLLRATGWVALGEGYNYTGRWDFARYGDLLIAVNGTDPPQYATLGVGGISDFVAIPGAPIGANVELVKEFIIMGGVENNNLQWCAIGDPLDWPIPGTNDAQYKQADEQTFPDTGAIVAVAGGLSGMDMLIFTERSLYRGQYIGTPYVFQFDILSKGRGCIAPRSVVTGDSAIYFLSEDGFYSTDGGSLRNIGFERVNNWFSENSDYTRRDEVRSTFDPSMNIAVWTFASVNAAAEVHDHILVYQTQLDRWSYARAITTEIFESLSLGRTLESLDSFGPLDSLPFSLDAKIYKGGIPSLAAFDAENNLVYFNALPMEAIIETAETGGERMFIHGIRPLIDGANSSASIFYRDFQHQVTTEQACSEPSAFDGIAYTHISTRYARARVTIPDGQSWRHALGCEVAIEEEGTI